MLSKIEHWESKGFRICITPMQDKSTWAWIAGVYIGNERKADWIKTPFHTYREAFNAILDYCENYKVKKKKC